jgi:hypothetical protein
LKYLAATVEEHSPLPFPEEIDEEMPLKEFWLDSVAFAGLLTAIEGEVGYIPSTILGGVAFPETIGELIVAYEQEDESV